MKSLILAGGLICAVCALPGSATDAPHASFHALSNLPDGQRVERTAMTDRQLAAVHGAAVIRSSTKFGRLFVRIVGHKVVVICKGCPKQFTARVRRNIVRQIQTGCRAKSCINVIRINNKGCTKGCSNTNVVTQVNSGSGVNRSVITN